MLAVAPERGSSITATASRHHGRRQAQVAGEAGGMDAVGRAAGKRLTRHARLVPLLAVAPAVALAVSLAGCATPVLPVCSLLVAPGTEAWVANYGWHTEIILPASVLTGGLAQLRTPGAVGVSFGFGKTDFMSVASPGATDFALGTIPGPAMVRVLTLRVPPPRSTGSPLVRVTLSRDGLSRLQTFLSEAIARGTDGLPVVTATPPDADTRFYAASYGYSLAYTCNSWAADGLGRAGLPMEFGVVFAGGVMRGVARVDGACAAN